MNDENVNIMNGETTSHPRKLNTSAFVILIIGLLLGGTVILYLGGVFDSPYVPQKSSAVGEGENVGAFHNGADILTLKKIRELEKTIAEDPTDNSARLQLAHLLNDSGFYRKAIENYETYLKNVPQDADVWIDLGVCYYQLRELNKAEEMMEKGIALSPNHQIGSFNLGIVNLELGNKKEAQKWLEKAVKIDPNSEIGKRAKKLLNH
jgi:TolA-binding protein